MNEDTKYQHMIAVERELIEIRSLLTELVVYHRQYHEEKKALEKEGADPRLYDDSFADGA